MQNKKEKKKFNNWKIFEFNFISFKKKNNNNLKNSKKNNKKNFLKNCCKKLIHNIYKIKLNKKKKKSIFNKTSELKCYKNQLNKKSWSNQQDRKEE